jgi:hypothetical protein
MTIREVKKWRKHWEDRGYELKKVIPADDAKMKRAFHRNHLNNMYILNYVCVRPKIGKKLRDDMVRVVSLGSYYPQTWCKSWFKNA